MVLELRHRWADGTTHVIFDPLERLAALTPRPRINLLLYYGVLGAVGMAGATRLAGSRRVLTTPGANVAASAHRLRTNWLWAEPMQRSFGFDVLACPAAGAVSSSSR